MNTNPDKKARTTPAIRAAIAASNERTSVLGAITERGVSLID